ncbi:MAG: sugar phosphate isomerase/epimerase [Clostridia bacterium]|nr:sugar phosphate isomerase/epimerase [Clostridia bacterium]
MAEIKLSAFSDEYAKDFEEQLKGMASLGIDFIELRHLDGKNISSLTHEEVKEAKKKMASFGIACSAIGSPIGKISLDGDKNEHLELAKRVFECACEMETPFVRMFSFYAPEKMDITQMKGQVLSSLESLVQLAEEYKITLCHENEALIYGDIPERCLEILDYFDGRLSCVFDMGNFVLEGVEPFSAYEKMKKYIAYFHIKDALFEGAIVPPGKGEGKIFEILDHHRKEAKQSFFVSLEPHLQTFSGLNALVGRNFENPYQYEDEKSAFVDAVTKFKELVL